MNERSIASGSGRLGQGHWRRRRRASGLLRAVVVAAATLAILFVCFSMYEFSQARHSTGGAGKRDRLPSMPTELSDADIDRLARGEGGVDVGSANVGKAENINISIYSREGTRAALELTVSDWIPREGSDHEFILKRPDVRMRTKDGNAVRVTADEGMLDARRKSGGGLDPRRGWLTGNVTIEFDRRTDADKAALPPERRDRPDPEDLVHVETETLEFDLEYDRLIVPGRLTLTGSDVRFEADDLEIRFNEAQSRVEAMRIIGGGSIELLESDQRLGFSIPRASAAPPSSMTVVEWIRATLEARLTQRRDTEGGADASPTGPSPASQPELSAEGIPVFHPGGEESGTPRRPPVRYMARFEDNVDARQFAGERTISRLRADALEVLRDFGAPERSRIRSVGGESTGSVGALDGPATPENRIHLTWMGRLALDALEPDHPRYEQGGRAKILAEGSPAELTGVEGTVVCAALVYSPDTSALDLSGTETIPVVISSRPGAKLSGRTVSLRREGERFHLQMTGPGVVSGEFAGMIADGGDGGAGEGPDGSIRFATEVRARGRVVRRSFPDLTGAIRTIESRLLEDAVVVGDVSLEREDARLRAEEVALAFGVRRGWQRDRQYLRHLYATGNASMTSGSDRITSDEIDVLFSPSADGPSLPTQAVASGNVIAVQTDRTLRAAEKLVVDFRHVFGADSQAEVSDAIASADQGAERFVLASGGDSGRSRAQASRLRAYGEVSVLDPQQSLEVAADRLDCTITDGRRIESAKIYGDGNLPASVRTDAFSVVAGEIRLDALTEQAQVPGAGSMTIQSRRDLDGRRTDQPVPVSITWDQRMAYEGQRNVANFIGNVRAQSDADTTFDCDALRAEFADVEPSAPAGQVDNDWSVLPLLARSAGLAGGKTPLPLEGRFGDKELTSIHANGNAVALTSEVDERTGKLKSRAWLAGPRLFANLRSEASKMLIEGAGTLMLEDFQLPDPTRAPQVSEKGDLFSASENSGPSKTLVEWQGRMWYDFSIDQVRFEENVDLKHLSGRELWKAFPRSADVAAQLPAGRRTFLASDVLIVDFRGRSQRSRDPSSRRLGVLSSERLRRFHASGNVDLQDTTEGLWLTAEDLVFERDRSILVIEGGPSRKARIVKQQVGRSPTHIDGTRFFYNLRTGRLDIAKPGVRGG